MAAYNKQSDIYRIKLAASKSKEAFIKEYINYDITDATDLYIQILNELEEAIKSDDFENFKNLYKAVDYTETCDTTVIFRACIPNPIKHTNLIILACKYNKIRILKYLFDDKKEVFKGMIISIGKRAIFPGDEDEAGHNAFYYAIRSGNLELLETLVKWVETCPKLAQPEIWNDNISKAYDELILKNVSLAEEVEIFVQNKLLDLRFFSNPTDQNESIKDTDNITGRIELVLETITALNEEFSSSQINEKFLFMATFIAKNIHVLKRLLKFTYDRIPWEEIEFCLVCYISSHTKRQEINLFYHATLDKSKILNYLKHFAGELEKVKNMTGRMNAKKFSVLPKMNREKIQARIIGRCPQFEELYKNYQQIRDVYSLEKMYYCIMVASSAVPQEREGQLIILRVLQVIGENLKNTLESPKLSATTSEFLLHSLPPNTRKIITDLRNSLSHGHSLSKRIEVEANANDNFFIDIQRDVKSIGEVIFEIFFNYKIKMIRILLQRIVGTENLNEIKETVKVLANAELNEMNFDIFTGMGYEKLKKLIKELSDNISDKTVFEDKLLNDIYNILNVEKKKSKNTGCNYTIAFATLNRFKMFLEENAADRNSVTRIKFCANKLLEYTGSEIDLQNIKMIAKLSLTIFSCYNLRIKRKNLHQMTKLMYEIFYIAEFGAGDVKWIKELKGKLTEISSSNHKYKIKNISSEKYNNQLMLKLSELKSVLTNYSLCDQLENELSFYKNNNKLQMAVEMLILDIMSILGDSKKKLVNNLSFFEETIPSLIGKSLRNHLAHDNALVDVLLPDLSLAIILNAKKLAEGNLLESEQKIGSLVCYNPPQLRTKYNERLRKITLQDKLFYASEGGNFKDVKDSLKYGADVRARNNSLRSALHFAAMGPSLEIIKYILNQNADAEAKDIDGRNPLHIAAAHGRDHTVKYIVEAIGLDVDDGDNNGRTAMHVAAIHGHKETVEILLKNKANAAAQDICGLSPIYYAIINNHTNIVKTLLDQATNVDIIEAIGGYTPLHAAAEFGNVELVNVLLENKANVNAMSDNDYTPLHAAALNDHLDVVNILILKGGNVNARVTVGCTPLYYAVEKCHQEIVEILLKNGAEVNVVDKTFLNAPLHYAARDGYTDIVKTLLKYNATGSLTNDKGFTPLHLAALGGHLEIVNILLNHGVNINSQDKNKYTPLHFAAEFGHEEVIRLLLKNGAEVNACSNNNLTAIYVAAMKGHKNIIEILIKYNANLDLRDCEGRTVLHAAVTSGNSGTLDILMQYQVDVNAETIDGITPLHEAALHGLTETVEILIENKGAVDIRNDCKVTPLHAAIIRGHKDVVNLLIKNKAVINARMFDIFTPLHIAIELGHSEIAQILIMNGANVDEKSNDYTPLFHAVRHNNDEIVEVLIANGADVNTEGGHLDNETSNPVAFQLLELSLLNEYLYSKTISPLSAACYFGYTNVVQILLKHKARVNINYTADVSPLHFAALKGHIEIVELLIESGAVIDALTVLNMTPLHFAAQEGFEEIVKILIRNGANVNIQSEEGVTPLHMSSIKGYSNAVKVLLDEKANVNLKDGKGRTALKQAVLHSNLSVVQLLLKCTKEDINAKDNSGSTLLHTAVQENNLELVKYLINEGSDINAIDCYGSKPIYIAARKGFKDIVELFLKMGSCINELDAFNKTLLHYTVMSDNAEIVKYLITQGANVNAKDKNDKTPLNIAATYGHITIIKILLKNGAFYDAVKTKSFEMFLYKEIFNLLSMIDMLFVAVRGNNTDEVQKLIDAGAMVNVKNGHNATPLHYAVWKGNYKMAKLLLENKANPNAEANNKCTPLHYAAKFSHLKIVIVLLSNGATYNVTTDSGKTPSNFTEDQAVNRLFKIVDESFKNVKLGNYIVISDLNKIKDISTMKAVMNARNEEQKTLIVVALEFNFPMVDALKRVLQDNASVKINSALELSKQGHYDKALNIFNNILEERKEILGADNPGTLDIELHIATVLLKSGSYQQALNNFERIYEKQKNTLGENQASTLSTKSSIAFVLHKRGSNEKALRMFREVYQKQKQILGSNNSHTLNTKFHMASVLNSLGNYEEALHINKCIYKKRKEMLGSESDFENDMLRKICAQNNIEMAFATLNENKQALNFYKKVFERKKKVLGISHSDTLRTLETIALELRAEKKYHEAHKIYEQVLQLQKDTFQSNHPDVLLTQCNLVNILFVQGKYVNALKTYRQISDLVRSTFESSHPIISEMFNNLEIMDAKFKLQGTSVAEVLQHLQEDIKNVAYNGDVPTLERLIKDGMDVNERDINGITALHFAVSNGETQTVKILLKKGADMFQVTNKGNSPLHIATSKNNAEITDILLQNVSRDKLYEFVNMKTTTAGTASLHVAAKIGSIEIVKALLKCGAVYNIENKENETPLDLAKDFKVVRLLQIIEELFEDAKTGEIAMINKLIAMHSDEFSAVMNARDKQGNKIELVVMHYKNVYEHITSELQRMLERQP